MQYIKDKLLRYLDKIGLKADFNLVLKKYSKTLYGRYNPNNNTVILYVFKDKSCTKSYTIIELLNTLIHEVCHCIQWSNPDYVRYKGVMHNTEFWSMYNKYTRRARRVLTDIEKRSVFTCEKIAL